MLAIAIIIYFESGTGRGLRLGWGEIGTTGMLPPQMIMGVEYYARNYTENKPKHLMTPKVSADRLWQGQVHLRLGTRVAHLQSRLVGRIGQIYR